MSLTPLQFLGKGVGHAAGLVDGLCLNDPNGLLAPDARAKLEAAANAILQFGVLAGPDALGFSTTQDGDAYNAVNDQFVNILHELPKEVARVPDAAIIRDAYFCGRCLGDLRSAIDAQLAFHDISRAEFKAIGPLQLMNFVHHMPSRRIELHFMFHTSKDTNLKRERSDLNDWAYLGMASAYCDVVVAEKQFSNIINRGTLEKKKVVISSLDELPTV